MNEFREVDCRRRAASSGCLDPASRNPVTVVVVSRIDTQGPSVNRAFLDHTWSR
jgi:hypothetical protein